MKTYDLILTNGTRLTIPADDHHLGPVWLRFLTAGQVTATYSVGQVVGFRIL